MNNRISHRLPIPPRKADLDEAAPQPLGEVLARLLAAYQTRFPEIRITLVETSATEPAC